MDSSCAYRAGFWSSLQSARSDRPVVSLITTEGKFLELSLCFSLLFSSNVFFHPLPFSSFSECPKLLGSGVIAFPCG